MLVHVSAPPVQTQIRLDFEDGFKNREDRVSCSQIDSMPLPDGRVPDEPQIVPDPGYECRFTDSKASTDTMLHHTSRGAPSTRNIYQGAPQYQKYLSRGAQYSEPYIKGAPTPKKYTSNGTPRVIQNGRQVPKVVRKERPTTKNYILGHPPAPRNTENITDQGASHTS